MATRLRIVAWSACALLVLAGAAQAATAAWIPAKAVLAQILLEHAFDRSLASHSSQKPWPWADMAPLSRLVAPRLGEDAIVLSGASGQALAFGPTQIPTPPNSGVTLLAAHRDTHFTFIRDLKVGDELISQDITGLPKRYRIERFDTVRWDQFAIPGNGTGEWLVLATCYPFDAQTSGPLRRIVWARRVVG